MWAGWASFTPWSDRSNLALRPGWTRLAQGSGRTNCANGQVVLITLALAVAGGHRQQVVPVSGQSRDFVEAVRQLASVQRWVEAARAESESLEFIDELVPAKDSPLTPG